MRKRRTKTHLVKEGSSKLVSLLMGFETACGIRKDNIWYTEDVNTATCKKCLQIARKTRPELFSNADRAQKIIQTEKDKVRLGITQSKLKVTAIGS